MTWKGGNIDPDSVINLPIKDGEPVFPYFECSAVDPFFTPQ